MLLLLFRTKAKAGQLGGLASRRCFPLGAHSVKLHGKHTSSYHTETTALYSHDAIMLFPFLSLRMGKSTDFEIVSDFSPPAFLQLFPSMSL